MLFNTHIWPKTSRLDALLGHFGCMPSTLTRARDSECSGKNYQENTDSRQGKPGCQAKSYHAGYKHVKPC